VIGIALALPMFLYVLLSNSANLGQEFDGTARINVYLSNDANAQQMLRNLRGKQEVAEATLITPEQALSAFETESGFSNILQSLPKNPLPAVIELSPQLNEPAQLAVLTTQLKDMAGIDRVAVDLEWLARLQALVDLGERFVYTLAVFLSLGVALAIGNTVRLAIENRRDEIEIVKLVGATDAFVRRPFLYLGFWYGVGGALIAWILVQGSLLVLSSPIQQLLVSYQNQFGLQGIGLAATLFMFAVGIGLGVGGAGLAVSRHLHTIEPK
jgi:cell division transport system permease protein